MNVVIINDTAHVNGGAAKLAIAEGVGLAERGHVVDFLAAVGPIAPELSNHPNIRVTCTEQFDLISDPNRLRAFLQGWWNFKAGRTAKRLFRSSTRESSVVHLHVWSRALSSSVARAALDAGFAAVCTLHDFQLACPTGTFFQHQNELICRLKPMSASCLSCNCDARGYTQKLWRVGRQAIQSGIGHIPSQLQDYIIHSQLARNVMAPYLTAEARVHALNAYVETTRMSPASPEKNEGFGYLGRLVREKGVMMLARSAAAEEVPVTFIGSGPLSTQIKEICPQAEIIGWVDSLKGFEYLRRMRALVFPSLWYETFGLVVLEAAAQGIPSIVPDTSAAREFVPDGVSGLHFRGGDEADLREKIRAMKDPGLASELGAEAYQRFWASPFHSLDAHITSLEAIYKNVLINSDLIVSRDIVSHTGVA